MAAPCGNCGKETCHFCDLARRDPRYAVLYGTEQTPFRPGDCIYRGQEQGRVPCESCGGNVEVKIFSCQKHGQCSLEKDVGHKTCGGCSDRRPFDLHYAHDWTDLGKVVPGDQRKFNSSLLPYKGQLILATRIHTYQGWSPGRIFLNRVDGNFCRTGETVEINVNHPQAAMGIEDPRLFIHGGSLHVAFTGVQKSGGGIATSQLYGRLGDNLALEELFAPHYPARADWEKNWGFFSEGGQLYAVYDIFEQKILKIDGNEARLIHSSRTNWPDTIAVPRGGASPIKRGNEYYSFFHDVRDGADGFREYKLCLYTFEDRPPFRVNRIARMPLFSADKKHRPNDTWTPNVVFPCGSFLKNNLWHVSAGYMDRWSWLLRFDVNKIEALLDIAVGGRDAGIFLRDQWDWDIWQNVVNQNEYELPADMTGLHVVDLGGHIGSFARCCLDSGAAHVLSIEPNPDNAAAFRKNLGGYWDRCTLLEGAAFGKPPESASVIGVGSGCRVITDGAGQSVEPLEIGPIQCDLLKMDIEGGEYEILANADLSGVKKLVGEGHSFDGLPGMDWVKDRLESLGFEVKIQATGGHTFGFWAER